MIVIMIYDPVLCFFNCRIFSTMADHPKIFSKVACFILADLVHSLQSLTLLPRVKVCLPFSFV